MFKFYYDVNLKYYLNCIILTPFRADKKYRNRKNMISCEQTIPNRIFGIRYSVLKCQPYF